MPERVAWWRSGLVAIAAMASVAATAWATARAAPVMMSFYIAWAGVPLVPLFFAGHRSAFRRACIAVGSCLLMVGVIFAVLGLVIYIPSALAVLGAGFAEGRLKWTCGMASFLIGVAALGGWTAESVRAFRPLNAFVVQFDQQEYEKHKETLRPLSYTPSPIGRGSTNISIGGTDVGPQWIVFFRKDISPEEKAVLQGHLSDLPSVTSVRPCEPPPWGCR
jgi:hypothetical protein